jgi:hypothetical protein
MSGIDTDNILTSDEVNAVMRVAATIAGHSNQQKFLSLLLHAFIQACKLNDIPDEEMVANFTYGMQMADGDGMIRMKQ